VCVKDPNSTAESECPSIVDPTAALSMSNRKNAHRASAGEIPEYKLLKNQQPTKQNVALFEAAKR
jgi:hypothetical protein